MSATFRRLATELAEIKRSPAMIAGRRGEPETYLSEIPCTALMPADPSTRAEVMERLKLQSPFQMQQLFVSGDIDVNEGDIITLNGRDYPIRAVGDWPWLRGGYKALIVEELKQQ